MRLDPVALDAAAKQMREMGRIPGLRWIEWEELHQTKQPYIATMTRLLETYFASLPVEKRGAA